MMTAGRPPQYKINWVRVYQDPNQEKQKVGCSTPERPTRRFIEAHEKLYKTVDDVSCIHLTFHFLMAFADRDVTSSTDDQFNRNIL